MEHWTLTQRLRELERQHEAAPRRRPQSPVRPARRHSPLRSGTQFGTPYERPGPRRMAQPSGCRLHARAPANLEPDSEGDVIMTSMPTNVRNRFVRMHPDPSCYTNSLPCTTADYRWKANSGAEMIGLPRTRAGTPYLPNDMGLGWYHLENGTLTTDEVYRQIGLIFRNRKEEAWLAVARSAFNLCRLSNPSRRLWIILSVCTTSGRVSGPLSTRALLMAPTSQSYFPDATWRTAHIRACTPRMSTPRRSFTTPLTWKHAHRPSPLDQTAP